MQKDPLFKGVYQVGLVVKDCMSLVKKYYHDYGIGPWVIYDMTPDTMKDMVVRGKPVEYAMRAACAQIGPVMIELIEPLDDKSIYSEFLNEHGDGIHHILFETEDYDKSVEFFKKKGHGILMGGTNQGLKFAYFDTTKDLGLITEIFGGELEDGKEELEPSDVYPRPE